LDSLLLLISQALVGTRCHARTLQRVCGMHVRCRGLMKKKHKKNHMEKDYCNLQCFPEKTIKKNLEKKNMKKERKKNLVKKHCSKIKTM
jgi:hypothetical protein